MKLVLCLKCSDVFKLDYELRKCKCGKSEGKYLDQLNAVYEGEFAIPLGIDNFSLTEAVVKQPDEGLGSRFTAFVIPKECPTFVTSTKKREVQKGEKPLDN